MHNNIVIILFGLINYRKCGLDPRIMWKEMRKKNRTTIRPTHKNSSEN